MTKPEFSMNTNSSALMINQNSLLLNAGIYKSLRWRGFVIRVVVKHLYFTAVTTVNPFSPVQVKEL